MTLIPVQILVLGLVVGTLSAFIPKSAENVTSLQEPLENVDSSLPEPKKNEDSDTPLPEEIKDISEGLWDDCKAVCKFCDATGMIQNGSCICISDNGGEVVCLDSRHQVTRGLGLMPSLESAEQSTDGQEAIRGQRCLGLLGSTRGSLQGLLGDGLSNMTAAQRVAAFRKRVDALRSLTALGLQRARAAATASAAKVPTVTNTLLPVSPFIDKSQASREVIEYSDKESCGDRKLEKVIEASNKETCAARKQETLETIESSDSEKTETAAADRVAEDPSGKLALSETLPKLPASFVVPQLDAQLENAEGLGVMGVFGDGGMVLGSPNPIVSSPVIQNQMINSPKSKSGVLPNIKVESPETMGIFGNSGTVLGSPKPIGSIQSQIYTGTNTKSAILPNFKLESPEIKSIFGNSQTVLGSSNPIGAIQSQIITGTNTKSAALPNIKLESPEIKSIFGNSGTVLGSSNPVGSIQSQIITGTNTKSAVLPNFKFESPDIKSIFDNSQTVLGSSNPVASIQNQIITGTNTKSVVPPNVKVGSPEISSLVISSVVPSTSSETLQNPRPIVLSLNVEPTKDKTASFLNAKAASPINLHAKSESSIIPRPIVPNFKAESLNVQSSGALRSAASSNPAPCSSHEDPDVSGIKLESPNIQTSALSSISAKTMSSSPYGSARASNLDVPRLKIESHIIPSINIESPQPQSSIALSPIGRSSTDLTPKVENAEVESVQVENLDVSSSDPAIPCSAESDSVQTKTILKSSENIEATPAVALNSPSKAIAFQPAIAQGSVTVNSPAQSGEQINLPTQFSQGNFKVANEDFTSLERAAYPTETKKDESRLVDGIIVIPQNGKITPEDLLSAMATPLGMKTGSDDPKPCH